MNNKPIFIVIVKQQRFFALVQYDVPLLPALEEILPLHGSVEMTVIKGIG